MRWMKIEPIIQSEKVKVTQLCPTLRPHWTVESMEFSRPQYWRQLTFPSLGDLLDPGIEPRSPALQADSLPAEPQVRKRKINIVYNAYTWNLERLY